MHGKVILVIKEFKINKMMIKVQINSSVKQASLHNLVSGTPDSRCGQVSRQISCDPFESIISNIFTMHKYEYDLS